MPSLAAFQKLLGTSATTTEALQFMVSQVGKPYIWGGTGPRGYDCTGLAVAGFRHAGINVSRFTTATLRFMGYGISASEVLPGDAIMPISSHVFWYIGDGKVVEAAHTGTDIRVRSWSPNNPGKVYAIRRIAVPGSAINVSGDIVGGAPLDSLTQMGSPENALFKLAEPLATLSEALTDKYFWMRVGMFMGGVVMMFIALGMLASSRIVGAVKGIIS